VPPSFDASPLGGSVLLASGEVLHLGQVAEIYQPATNTWQPAVSPFAVNPLLGIVAGVEAASAILLPNGRVLAGTSIYDPIMQCFCGGPTVPSNFGDNLGNGTVTALQDGNVIADGGYSEYNSESVLALYNFTQNSWSVGGSQAYSGGYAASGVLANGQVLVTGGAGSEDTYGFTPLSTAGLFDPATNTWTPAASLSAARLQHTATVLQNGSVLVTGGNNTSIALSSAEVYDPSTNAWSSTGTMSSPRYQHTASLLGSGLVLVAGGNNLVGTCSCTTFVSSVDLYNPATNTFTPTGALVTARYAHTATVLANGMVLVAGGFGGPTNTLQSGGASLSSAELYNPTTGTWAATGSMATARMNHTATLLPGGTSVLVAGGYTGTATTATAEIYSFSTGTWTAVASMNTPRQSQQAVLLSNGTVLEVGGLNDTSSAVIGVGTTEVYDPAANTWTLSGSMMTTRQFFILNTLNDGRILLDGGLPNTSGLPEFYE
jgi:N-acetylneuraminic acid mutarotase